MRLLLKVISLCLISPVSLMAQDNVESDPFDLKATQDKIKEFGVPTVAAVDAMEAKAKSLYASQRWGEAATAMHDYARQANWLANLISASLQPYYGASYDDRKSFSYAKAQALIPLENRANEYKEKRNRAMVMEAECYVKLGERGKAVALLVKALDLISLENDDWWTRARDQLFALIQYE